MYGGNEVEEGTTGLDVPAKERKKKHVKSKKGKGRGSHTWGDCVFYHLVGKERWDPFFALNDDVFQSEF